MTKKKAAAEAQPSIDPDKEYLVTLNRVIKLGKVGSTILSPKHENKVRGSALSTIFAGDDADAIAEFKEV